jgi:hypothetical protein
MPGSKLKSITNTVKKEIATLTRDDVIVVLGGTNDIDKINHLRVSHISSFVKNRGHAPHRDDLDETCCINSEVKVFNRKLLKKMKMYGYAKVIETTYE